ncbi:MAG: hypothetical protein WC466_07410 [Candidatus Izemoplasmatales bacterium]
MAKSKKEDENNDFQPDLSNDLKSNSPIKKKFFNLSDYKKERGLDNVKFKSQEWLNFPSAFIDATGVPGIPLGSITLLRGHSDTSKSTALILSAIEAQKKNILPVFIITEMKWSWEHAKLMGLQFEETVDNKGVIENYDGFFIYADRGQLKTIEDVAAFINNLLDEQETGKLPFDLLFLWDSIGSVPCQMSVEKGKNNNEWNAGAISVQFGSHVNQRIVYSRKEDFPFVNTLVCVNKVWVRKPDSPMGQPVMKNKGGDTMYYDASFVITFGNIATAGINKIRATKNGKEVLFGTRVKVQIEKNHINGISTTNKIIVTPTGYIADDKKAIDAYKKQHLSYFMTLLGEQGGDFDTIIDETEEPDTIVDEPNDE